MIIKTCLWCKKSFKSRPDRGIFCSRKCRGLSENMKINITCQICGTVFYAVPARGKRFCSKPCVGKFNRERCKFGNVPNWKGDNVSYRNLHKWVVKWRGQPDTCEDCGKKGTSHQMHWANKSHQYLRQLSDWIRLCVKCHKKYDKS